MSGVQIENLVKGQNLRTVKTLKENDYFVLSPSTAENMPSGVTNSPTSTGSEGVSHPNHPTATGMLIIDPKRRNSFILSVLAVFIFIQGIFIDIYSYHRQKSGHSPTS